MIEPEGREQVESGKHEARAGGERNKAPRRETFGGAGFIGETDRENGEYHYRNGFTQKIYSDAHYVPADENTTPPKYYTPPEKPEREAKPPRPKKNSRGLTRTFFICLVCALLGGAAGSAIVGRGLAERITDLETELDRLTQAQSAPVVMSPAPQASTAFASAGGVDAGQIYEQACRQVVGITTEVITTNIFGMTSSSSVSGSGFIISQDGYILTNYHVIENAYKGGLTISVMLKDGSAYEATIVGVENDGSDLAVLKIEAAGLSPISLGNSDEMSVGDDVFVVGNPLGELEFSQTQGHVSALDRLISTDSANAPINMFQIDAAVNHGNSGGPVYNDQGQVIGVVTAKYSDTGIEGLGFAIPINEAASIASDLITKGYVTGKASLGVEIDRRYNSMYSQYYGMPIGAYVDSVVKGSCAEKAGLRAGDIITRLGEEDISGYEELRSAIRQYNAGDSAEISFYRAGESLTVTVTFDEEQPDASQRRASSTYANLG